jgi:hypothetical protein
MSAAQDQFGKGGRSDAHHRNCGGRRRRRFGESHRTRVGIGPSRRLHRESRVVDRHQADSARGRGRGEPLARVRHAVPASAETHRDLAVQIGAHLGGRAISTETHGCIESRGQRLRRPHGNLMQKAQLRFAAGVVDHREVRALRLDSHFVKPQCLGVSAGIPRRFQARCFEARRDISHGARMAGRPCVASLHVVPGEIGGDLPPVAGIGVTNRSTRRRLADSLRDQGDHQTAGQGALRDHDRQSFRCGRSIEI